ncbi:MAG: acyl-CoA thioesterase [Spirochaetia bacterium]|nr:acyl-CoA thioesterase [Spirochaetia bacterium]
MRKIFSLQVRSYEIDSLGHVNNAVYMNYFELGRIDFFKQLGFDLRAMFQSGITFVLAESHVKFRLPSFIDETLLIESELTVEKVRMRFSQIIRRESATIATGDNTLVTLDTRGRPTVPPADLIQRLQSGAT